MAESCNCWIANSEAGEDSIFRRRRSRSRSGLDITPMIDIVFLLLIYFLVSTIPDRNAALDLPAARHGEGVRTTNSVIFTIGQGGIDAAPVYLGDGRLPENRLPSELGSLQEAVSQNVRDGLQQGKANVLIKADKGVAHRDVSTVADAVSHVDGIQLHFAVLEVD